MKVGDLVKHKFSGVGVIINIHGTECYKSDIRVVFMDSGRTYWVKPSWLEVLSENR
jgi:hypothetical protein